MIPIHNIYCMLAYTFQILEEKGFSDLGTENFENQADLMAEILLLGTDRLIKRGLQKDYEDRRETGSLPRGKIIFQESVHPVNVLQRKLVYDFQEYTLNSRVNQVLKSVLILLTRADISPDRKKKIRRILQYFKDVSLCDLSREDWHFRYDRNNGLYRMLMGICELVVKGLLQKNEDGNLRISSFLDQQSMYRLYEKFILNYCRKHYPQLQASAEQIPWLFKNNDSSLLPVMKTDITLHSKERILIIDAKYYQKNLAENFGKKSVHSSNMYQIFSYVMNMKAKVKNPEFKVSGMLLYARTEDEIQPDETYLMEDGWIAVKNLDLNLPFAMIKDQLDLIVKRWLD